MMQKASESHTCDITPGLFLLLSATPVVPVGWIRPKDVVYRGWRAQRLLTSWRLVSARMASGEGLA